MVAVEVPLYVHSATADEAQRHLDGRECDSDHESVRYGAHGWQLVYCGNCAQRD